MRQRYLLSHHSHLTRPSGQRTAPAVKEKFVIPRNVLESDLYNMVPAQAQCVANSSSAPGSISKVRPYFLPSPPTSTPIVKHDYGPCQPLNPLRRSKAGRPRGRKDIQARRSRGFWEGVPAFEQLRLRRVRASEKGVNQVRQWYSEASYREQVKHHNEQPGYVIGRKRELRRPKARNGFWDGIPPKGQNRLRKTGAMSEEIYRVRRHFADQNAQSQGTDRERGSENYVLKPSESEQQDSQQPRSEEFEIEQPEFEQCGTQSSKVEHKTVKRVRFDVSPPPWSDKQINTLEIQCKASDQDHDIPFPQLQPDGTHLLNLPTISEGFDKLITKDDFHL